MRQKCWLLNLIWHLYFSIRLNNFYFSMIIQICSKISHNDREKNWEAKTHHPGLRAIDAVASPWSCPNASVIVSQSVRGEGQSVVDCPTQPICTWTFMCSMTKVKQHGREICKSVRGVRNSGFQEKTACSCVFRHCWDNAAMSNFFSFSQSSYSTRLLFL